MSSVTFEGVTVAYNGAPVVNDVSFVVGTGEWLAVLGPNGAGKSTLLRTVVGGLISEGTVTVGDVDIHVTRQRQRGHLVAYVPQRPIFPKGMSVFDYVLLGRTPHMGTLMAESQDDVSIVWEAIEALDLIDFVERDVSALSGGETQRVAMARVMAQQAPVLVLDEATAALDVARQHQVLELIDEVRTRTGLTVVSAMHDLTAAAQFCDRVGVMNDGQLLGVGPPGDVLTEDLLRSVFEPTVRVIEIEGMQVIVSMREPERR